MTYVKTNNVNATVNTNVANECDVPDNVTLIDVVVVTYQDTIKPMAKSKTNWVKHNMTTSQLGRDTYRAVKLVRNGQFKTIDAAMASLGYTKQEDVIASDAAAAVAAVA